MRILLFLALSSGAPPVASQTTAGASWGYYRIGQIDQTTTSDANTWNTIVVDAGHIWTQKDLGIFVLAETLGSSAVVYEPGPDALIRRRDARVRRSSVKVLGRRFLGGATESVRMFVEAGPALYRITSTDALRETSVRGYRWGQSLAVGLAIPDSKVTWIIRARYDRVGSVDRIDTSGFGITAGLAIGPP